MWGPDERGPPNMEGQHGEPRFFGIMPGQGLPGQDQHIFVGEFPGPILLGRLPPPSRPGPMQHPQDLLRSVPIDEISTGAVSSIHRLSTENVKKLHIFDPSSKLRHSEIYDIGGTYCVQEGSDAKEPEFWFFFKTTVCHGHDYLLNLFVCHRKTGCFSIGVPEASELNPKKKANDKTGISSLPSEPLHWQSFRNTQPNENFYIKTYCFTESDLRLLENLILAIPIKIQLKSITMSKENIEKIKLDHDFADVLIKKEKSDFILISASQKQYPVHKIFLAAHCPVFRNILKNRVTDDNQLAVDINDSDMELLLEFIYTGTIKNVLEQDCLNLLAIADRFQLKDLFALTQITLGNQITVQNAIEVAILSEKYKLEKLQLSVFNFIKTNPKVMETEGWRNLEDVNLAKKLFQHIQAKKD